MIGTEEIAEIVKVAAAEVLARKDEISMRSMTPGITTLTC